MVKPSLPHHDPIFAGTMAPIVPPSQSMVPLISAGPAVLLQQKRLGCSGFLQTPTTPKQVYVKPQLGLTTSSTVQTKGW